MKKLTVFLAIVAVALMCAFGVEAKQNSAKSGGVSKIQMPTKVFDFGVVKEKGGPVVHEFEFTNVGDGNLLILKATAECGCTRPEYLEKPIAPGKKGKIKVTYNPAGRPGAFDKVVTITTNGQPRKVRVKIRGTVAN